MYAHVLRRLGRMTDAIAEFRRADDLEATYLRVEEIPVEYDWHFQHNLELLGTSYQYVGKMVEAEPVLRRAFEIDSLRSAGDELNNKKVWPMFLLASGRTSEAVAASKAMTEHRMPLVRALGYLFTGRALMADGQTRQSAAVGNEALRIMRSMDPLGGVLLPDFELTQGEYLIRTGELRRGRSMLHEAIAKFDRQSNPDSWIHVLFAVEAVTRIARELDDWELADQMATRMQARDPEYAGTQYALGRVAEHSGDLPSARVAYARAIQLWKDADPRLRELVDARQRLERLSP
jgi:tetratricopeptide (TPR) repeat protein